MPRPLKIGVQLPEVEYDYDWPQLKEMTRTVEAIGLDSIWLGDHLMYRPVGDLPARGPFEAWSTMAALAAVTERVQIGPLVASLGFHTPPMIAKKAATIDRISGGRFILGVGSGWNEDEYRGFGLPFDHRVSRFAEALAIIRELFATGACDFHGDWYDVDGALLFPKAIQPGGPPLLLGSFGPRMLHVALPHVQMWNAWNHDYGNTREGLAQLMATIDAACDEVGRDPATLARTVCPLVRMTGGKGRPSGSGEVVPPLDGTDPAALASELKALAAMGIAHVMLVLDPITADSIAELEPTLRLLDG
jgi:alkanesulfonate monooxygenase SsuD/methylene tetrahydromethanopterin reductase-like flavin-dependent oxidoreductase (luciferase family)